MFLKSDLMPVEVSSGCFSSTRVKRTSPSPPPPPPSPSSSSPSASASAVCHTKRQKNCLFLAGGSYNRFTKLCASYWLSWSKTADRWSRFALPTLGIWFGAPFLDPRTLFLADGCWRFSDGTFENLLPSFFLNMFFLFNTFGLTWLPKQIQRCF